MTASAIQVSYQPPGAVTATATATITNRDRHRDLARQRWPRLYRDADGDDLRRRLPRPQRRPRRSSTAWSPKITITSAGGGYATAPTVTISNLITLSNVVITPQDLNAKGSASSFLVSFSPLTGVGTYSYAIGPNVSDRIRTATLTNTLLSSGNKMDQNADGQPGQVPLDEYATPRPVGGTPFQSPYDPTTLPLIVPGPHIVISSTVPLNASLQPIVPTNGENLALNTIVPGIQVTFDRDMRVNTFSGSDILSLVGPIGPVPGPFTVQQVGSSLRESSTSSSRPRNDSAVRIRSPWARTSTRSSTAIRPSRPAT